MRNAERGPYTCRWLAVAILPESKERRVESYPGTSHTWSYDWVGNRLDGGWAYNGV